MNLTFYFNVSILWSLKYVLTFNYVDYKLYLAEVVNHIEYHNQHQEKLNFWHNINMTNNSINLLNSTLNQNNMDSILTPQIFHSIFNSINCRYEKLLKIYDSYIKTMISECENDYNKKLFAKFIECTKLVQDVVGKSNCMFETLYNILIFMKNLDIKFIFKDYIAPISIIDEICTIYTFTSSNTKPCTLTYIKSNGDFDTDDACKEILNIKYFHTTVTDMFNNLQFLDTVSNITGNFVHEYLLKKYNEKNVLQPEKDKSFFQFIYDDLILFYDGTIKHENDNLGFQELLHPTMPGLVPPLIVINTEHKITTLNKLFSKRYFKKPFMNVNIVLENNEQLDTSILLKTEVNYANLKKNERYFEQLLRVRYAKILKIYERLLINIIKSCRDEQFISTINIFNKQYVECINELRNSVSLSVNMLKSLLSALTILKKSYIWEYSKNTHNCLHITAVIITELFYDLRALNIGPYKNTKTMNEEEAKMYFYQLSESTQKLKNSLKSEVGKGRFKSRCKLLKHCKYNLTKSSFFNLKTSLKYDGPVYKLICLKMNIFCKEIIKTDYENLGFKDLI